MASGAWIVPAGFMKFPEEIMRSIKRQSEVAMQKTVDQCVDDVKRFISSRPRPTSKFGGRINSSDLLKSIAGRVYWKDDVIMGEIYHNDGGQDYYILQIGGEIGGGQDGYMGGFTHVPDGAWIESSFAARDAAIAGIQRLMEELENIS